MTVKILFIKVKWNWYFLFLIEELFNWTFYNIWLNFAYPLGPVTIFYGMWQVYFLISI